MIQFDPDHPNDNSEARDGMTEDQLPIDTPQARQAPHPSRAPRPTLSVVIPTTRGGDSLARLILSLADERDWIDQLVVVPNGCDADQVRRDVETAINAAWGSEPLAWKVIESGIGLSRARNVGLRAATGELCALIDDDVVVQPGWGRSIATAAQRHPQAIAISALVQADNPTTEAATWFEASGGFGKGHVERVFRPVDYPPEKALRQVAEMGTGAACVLRTEAARAFGGYSEALGAGTPAFGGEDLNILLDILDDGGTVVYDPDIVVSHPAPATWETIRRQTFRYGIGLSALVTHRLATGRLTLTQLLRLFFQALTAIAGRSGYAANTHVRFPLRLRALELCGLTLGPFAYARSSLAERRNKSVTGSPATDELHHRTIRSGYFLIINTAATAILGLAYWAIAARLMPPAALGTGAALISLITALSTAGQLNFALSLPVLLPRAGNHRRRLLFKAYTLALGLTALIGLGTVLVLPDALGDLNSSLTGSMLFLTAMCLWTIFAIEDGALMGAHKSWVVPVENGIFGVLKLAALVGLAVLVGGDSASRSATTDADILTASWYLPLIVIIPSITLVLLRELGQDRDGSESPPPRIRQFVAFDYLGSLLMQAGSTALPFIIAITLNPSASAMFVAAWTLSTSVDVLAGNLATPLSVAVATSPHTSAATARAIGLRVGVILVPAVIVGIVAAPTILEIFGKDYSEGSVEILRLLLLASLPRAAATLALAGLRARQLVRPVAMIQGATSLITLTIGLGLEGVMGITSFGLGWLAANLVAAVISNLVLRSVTANAKPLAAT